MDRKPNVLAAGTAVLALAVVLRLLGGGLLTPVMNLLRRPETVAVLLYLESGRVAEPTAAVTKPPDETQPEPPATQLPPAAPVFGAEEAASLDVDYDISEQPDEAALLQQQLSWPLGDGAPRVLILHTHATECYTPAPGEDYELQLNYRTMDEAYNMVSIGGEVTRLLTQAGIGVVHDTQFHDYPSFNSSYSNAREATQGHLEENPGICLVLDLHRDAADTPTGQMDTSATVDGQEAAQLMIVVGTDAGGLYHPGWHDNLALALKLQALLEKAHPGLCRPVNVCVQRFNEDLNPGALLIEVGAAGNTHGEAMLAARALAEGIVALSGGANLTEDSAS